jgi:hypothetical protein
MGTHEAEKSHPIAAVIVGWVLITIVWAVFGFLAGDFTVYVPMLIAYAVWTVVSLKLFGGVGDHEADHEAAH